MMQEFRTLWFSDIHLGTKAARAEELLEFLSVVRAERVYLVGDVIDLQRMRTRASFPDSHMKVVTEFARLVRNGTDVVYIPGNHDVGFRRLAGTDVLGIQILLEATHTTQSGQKLLVVHGDVLDAQVCRGTKLEKAGAAAYARMLDAEASFNQFRRRLGLGNWSISGRIKSQFNHTSQYVQRFEAAAAEYTASRGYDGIVCGHIHSPDIRYIDNCLYINTGDWVEHCTALAEMADGELRMLSWDTGAITNASITEVQPLLA